MNNKRAALQFTDTTLWVEGEVDFATVVALCTEGTQWLRTTAAATCRIDFSRVSQCNSAATTLLLHWLRAAQSVNKTVTIDNIPHTLQSLLKLGGLDNLLELTNCKSSVEDEAKAQSLAL